MTSAMAPGPAPAPAAVRERFERMHRTLRSRICLLDYPPGMRLSETGLAQEFGVSRTPLRRVLARLEDDGLVQSVHGAGTFVTDVTLEALAQTYALREEITGLIGCLSPQPPDAALLDEFRAVSRQSRALLPAPDARGFAALITRHFMATLQLTGNRALRDTAERLYHQTARIWLQSVSASVLDLKAEMALFDREAGRVLAELEHGDVAAAAALLRAHVAASFERMRKAGGVKG